MATTSTSTAVAVVEPVFTESERLALAGFLAGYTGLTREAYALDLRQFASWCQLCRRRHKWHYADLRIMPQPHSAGCVCAAYRA
jgi:hypothetical protein